MIVKNLEKKEKNTVVFQVESDAAEFEAAVNAAYLKNRTNIYIPGFRKGKAPRAVVEGMYGHEVFYQDALDELAPKAFEFGVKEYELHVVGTPSIVDVNVSEEKTASFSFGVAVYPEVTLGQYKGLEAEKTVAEVTDEEVETEIQSALRQNSRVVTVDDRPAQMGDTANIDFDGYLNGERFDGGKAEAYPIELGSHTFVPGFEEQVVGMSIGEEKDINITFPEQYVENLAGKDVVFKVKLNGLTYNELPAADDEFAKDVSEFDTFEEYKADLRKQLEKRKEEEAEAKFRSQIVHNACDNMTVEIPDAMISDKVEEIVRNYAANFGMSDPSITFDQLLEMMGINEEVINTSIRPNAEFQVRSELLLNAIAKEENITVTDEEMEEYLKKVASSINAEPEQVRSYFGAEFMQSELKKEKASAIVLDSAVVKKAKKTRAKKAAPKAEAENSAEETAEADKPAEKPARKPRAKKAPKTEEAAE